MSVARRLIDTAGGTLWPWAWHVKSAMRKGAADYTKWRFPILEKLRRQFNEGRPSKERLTYKIMGKIAGKSGDGGWYYKMQTFQLSPPHEAVMALAEHFKIGPELLKPTEPPIRSLELNKG